MNRANRNFNYQGPFGNTLLHSAVVSGDLQEVKRLLNAGADPSIVNREGQTALRIAAILGHPEVYHLLASQSGESGVRHDLLRPPLPLLEGRERH